MTIVLISKCWRALQRICHVVGLGWLAAASLIAAAAPTVHPLVLAVRQNDAATWQRLLQAESDVSARDSAGNTALHFAALNHDLIAVRALIAAGAEIDAKNNAGATPLIYGAGDAGIVRALLERGADANAVSKLMVMPLMVAAAHPESYEAVRLLLEAGANIRAIRNKREVVLPIAVNGGDRRTIDLLLERGAAADGETVSIALATAAFQGNAGLVRLFVERGGDPNYESDILAGHSLNNALFAAHVDVAHLLTQKGADLNLRSQRGLGTPPMVWTAYNQTGDATMAKTLVEAGADVNAADNKGETALSYALRSGTDTPLVRYLESAGAKTREPPRVKHPPERAVPPTAAGRAAVVKARLQATLDVLQRSSDAFLANGFVQQVNCTSCHGQDLPPRAYALARARGFRIDDISLGRQFAAQRSRWETRAENARQMMAPVPGSPVSIAYGLFGLRATGQPADDMTDAMVRYVLRTQKSNGRWNDFTRRPPMEDGTLVSTGWVTLAIRDYTPVGYARAAADAQARAARWLARQEAANTNEQVFQLLGMHWAGEPTERLRFHLDRLIRAQRPDGGWSQLPGIESDAWATGSALFALHEIGGLRPTDEVYQNGVAFLLRTQFEDGSWWVRSRSWPFQPHFNGQFPHGKDQWISQGATAWAAMALLLTLDPIEPAPRMPTVPELIAAFAKSPAAQEKRATSPAIAAADSSKVDFTRDIQPLLERSCTGCHDGDKPRAQLTVTSRDALLKGGASGEPAITPGSAETSPLIHYVSGKIEDLEMPPLDRRNKYPALSPAEIDLLRAWIDAGAPVPGAKSAALPKSQSVTAASP
jgi:ankyrin repeat protein